MSLQEKCGIFGVWGKNIQAARLVRHGLELLQHRGQEASGMVSTRGQSMRFHKGTHLVSQVYGEDDIRKLSGHAAIGHNRYSTSGGTSSEHIQPVFDVYADYKLALAHNGNLPDTSRLQAFLDKKGISTDGCNDSDMMHQALTYRLENGAHDLADALDMCFELFTGVFSMLLLTRSEIVAVRDKFGVRPLSLGHLENGYAVSSESCALDIIGATDQREIEPGEIVTIDQRGVESIMLRESQLKIDAFEFVYFARPDSKIAGIRVLVARKRMGALLAKQVSIKFDVIIPVPDSGRSAAIGYSHASGIPFDEGLIKNKYVDRSFIEPAKEKRISLVNLKLRPVPEILKGRSVGVVDDSIVRGTTSVELVRMIREAGAKEVHLLIPAPPVRYPDFYGINTPRQTELIAYNKSVEEIGAEIGADSLHFLSLDGLVKAIGLPKDQLCLSCFNMDYPVDLGRRAAEVKKCKYSDEI